MKNYHLKEYFTQKEWIIFFIIIILGIVLRWYGLDDRPIHHDESLHALYSKYVYVDSKNLYYRYDALLHGPLLYNILPYIYQVFGTTKFSARILSCAIGTVLIFLPLLFNKFLKRDVCLLITAFIALSPSMIYWSRFIRHDCLVFLFMSVMLVGVFLAPYRLKSLFVITGLVLQFCAKENAYITSFLLLVWIFFEYFFGKLFAINSSSSLLSKILTQIKKHPWIFVGSIGLAIFIYMGVFSSGFRHAEGILDGLYRKSVVYWFGQHKIERIKGPFIFHIASLSWYDFLFMLAVIVQAIHFYIKNSWRYLLFFGPAIFVAVLCHILFFGVELGSHPLWEIPKLKTPLDFYPLFLIPMHAILITIAHLKNKRPDLGFWGYFFFATLFTYSYAGEKVPWLTQYALVTGLVYMAVYFGRYHYLLEINLPKTKIPLKHVLLGLIVIFNLRMAIITNFSRSGDDTEFISQVHTTETYEKIALAIRDELKFPYRGYRPAVYAAPSNTWPITWYFWGLPNFYFQPGKKKVEEFDYVFTSTEDKKTEKVLKETHRKIRITLRAWWVPDYKEISWVNFLSYAMSHNPWSPTGGEDITLFARK